MLISDYISAGYPVSNLIPQAVVTRAEKDVIAAYLVPILGEAPTATELEEDPLKSAFMALTSLRLQQRSIVATRAGGKTKMTDQSSTPTYEDVLRQNARVCHDYLKAVDTDIRPEDVVSDICGIYFRTNYFYHN